MPKPKSPKPVERSPYLPVDYNKIDAASLQAMSRGEATHDQQVHALYWIIQVAADRTGMSYGPKTNQGVDMAFHEGRRFVGNTISDLIKIPLSKIKDPTP